MKNITQRLMAALLLTTFFAACSRPVAYFQPSQREHFAKAPVKETPVAAVETTTPTAVETPVATSAEEVAKASDAMTQVDALVSNNKTLSADKAVQKRLNRVRTLLASASTKAAMAPAESSAPKKRSLMERLVLKKMNKKISKQLAPANPEKTMISTGTLATGAVLVIVGLLLVLLTTGTIHTVGLVALLIGAVVLLVGLL